MSLATAQIESARRVDLLETALRFGKLKKIAKNEYAGPCPVCGGRDRFSVNTKERVWNCRGCGKGGDVIELVRHKLGKDFPDAIAYLTGEKVKSARASRLPRFHELVAASAYVPPPACCQKLEIKCEHWQEFDRQYLIAHLRDNLACAKREIINLFAAAREPLGVEELFEELHAAVGFGAIAPPELPRSVVDRAIAELALEEKP